MAQQTINVGTAPNDGTGTPLRTAFQYTNSNFSELYTAVGPSGNNIVVPGSATISGDLTVDTSTLKVDSANDRVGVGTTTPSQKLEVFTASSDTRVRINSTSVVCTEYFRSGTGLWLVGSDSTNAFKIARGSNFGGSADYFSIAAATADATWYDSAGGTRMTLNSTGLGVGVVPSSGKFEVGIGAGTTTPLFRFYGNSGSWNGQFNFDASGNLQAYSYNGTKFTDFVWPYGNVGIGVTPSAWSNSGNIDLANGFIGISSSGTYGGAIANNAYYNAGWKYKSANYANLYLTGAGEHKWLNAPVGGAAGNAITFTQAMTLDASGNLLVGTTGLASNEKLSVVTGNTTGAVVKNTGGATYSPLYVWNATTTGDGYFSAFFTEASATLRGSITYNRAVGQVSYNITSDYRLKEDVKPLVGALNRISSLKPSTYKLKETGFTCEGFIAHELAEVIPSAVTGEKDAVNEDGSIKPQQIDLSKVVPVLVAAIQELAAEVNALKNA